MKKTTYDPYDHVHRLGVPVIHRDLGPNKLGLMYDGVIYLKPDQSGRQERCTLSHEIVHYEYQDCPTLDSAWHARREARCDRIAAQRLIDPDHFMDCVKWTMDPGAWVIELNVTRRILKAYLKEHAGRFWG